MTESDTADYYVGIGVIVDGKRTVIPISTQRDINAEPVQITVDNGLRTPVLMLELHRDYVAVGGWPDGEQWVEHLNLRADRETKLSGPTAGYEPPRGLTLRVGAAWEGTYGLTLLAMLSDALLDGDVEIEVLGNLGDDAGEAVCRGYLQEVTPDFIRFRGGLHLPLDAVTCVTLID